MTPVEGAHWLGIPNLLFVTQDHTRPYPRWAEIKWKAKTTMDQWAISFESLKKVSWSAVGSSGGGGLKTLPDIVSLAKGYGAATALARSAAEVTAAVGAALSRPGASVVVIPIARRYHGLLG